MELDLGETALIAMLLLSGVVTLPYLLATFISGFSCGYNGGPPKLRKPRGGKG
ncbi:MAG: hypothetical protein MK085_08645 [Phycisphaerales bacterium]|nr:hypothetical protein [Phycisphaerales bacterium]